jgi:hypothetical protein
MEYAQGAALMTNKPSQAAALETAVRAGCTAADVHITCSFPQCKCKQIPAAVKAALDAVRGREGANHRGIAETIVDMCRASPHTNAFVHSREDCVLATMNAQIASSPPAPVPDMEGVLRAALEEIINKDREEYTYELGCFARIARAALSTLTVPAQAQSREDVT